MLLVGCFGGLGAAVRELLIYTVVGPLGSDNVAILVANIVGCVVIGLVAGMMMWERPLLGRDTKLTLTTGAAGGLTTFSSLIWATVSQFPDGSTAWLACFWLLANVVLGFGAVAASLALAHGVESGHHSHRS